MKRNDIAKERNVNIITNNKGNKIAVINNIIFKGKRSINWKNVEQYLRQYIGELYVIVDTKESVYIGSDLPDEYSNSNYTHRLKVANAKAKANAVQRLPEMITIAACKQYEKNKKSKHNSDARYGWYRYESRFALPVFGENGDAERYNVFRALLLMRHAKDNKIYLYDIMEIKKKRANFSSQKTLLSRKPISFNKYHSRGQHFCQLYMRCFC